MATPPPPPPPSYDDTPLVEIPITTDDAVTPTILVLVDPSSTKGFYSDIIEIDNTKTYRFSCWIKRTGDLENISYFGFVPYPDFSDTTTPNALYFDYFTHSGESNVIEASYNTKWMLVVGYIYPVGTSVGTSTNIATSVYSGWWNTAGDKITPLMGRNFVWASDNAAVRLYSVFESRLSDFESTMLWFNPRIEVVDGTEPTVAELIRDYPSRNNSIPRSVNFGNIRIGDFLKIPVETYTSKGFVKADGTIVDKDIYIDY
jgi:hypothetical protein